MESRLLFALILIFINISAYGLTLKYKQITGTNDTYFLLTMKPVDKTYHLTVFSAVNGNSDFTVNSNFSTLKWKFLNPNKKIDIHCVRTGNIIMMKGTNNGVPIENLFSINDGPWIQQWEIGLEGFILSEEEQRTFWSINPNDLNIIAEFIAVKIGEETIDVNGSKIDAIKTKVSLTGIAGAFFNFNFYFRKTDGRLLAEVFPRDSRGFAGRVELMSEEK